MCDHTTLICSTCGKEGTAAYFLASKTSPAKAAAAKTNGAAPCAPGKVRGRPRTKPSPLIEAFDILLKPAPE